MNASKKSPTRMRWIINGFKSYIFKGFLTLIPIALSLLVVKFFFSFVDKKVIGLFDQFIGYHIPGLGILLLIVFLFLVGFLASNLLGRQIFGFIENILNRLPFIKAAYGVGKQFSQTISQAEQPVFQKAVLVDYMRSESWTIGFAMGESKNARNNNILVKVFVPTAPTPFGGFIVWVDKTQVMDPGWRIDEAMKIIVSCGIIGGEEIK